MKRKFNLFLDSGQFIGIDIEADKLPGFIERLNDPANFFRLVSIFWLINGIESPPDGNQYKVMVRPASISWWQEAGGNQIAIPRI